MKVLVLGGYGLIGSAVVDRLLADGHAVIGLGRDIATARRHIPRAGWIAADIGRLLSPDDWQPLLHGVDAVVNAAGALQDGARDRLDLVHGRSIAALVRACETTGIHRFVQISAVGVEAHKASAFFATKAIGDGAVAASSLDWTILRPGLVIAPAAYGGTALLRALAAFPGFIPAVKAAQPLQAVSVFDVADAVSRAVAGKLPRGLVADLVEERTNTLAQVLAVFRVWLGLPPARIVPLPAFIGKVSGLIADGLGWLGWRSPLRSAALAAIASGVTGDPARWREVTGRPLASLDETLSAMPAQVQERWFARLWLLKPAIFACLAAFWLASGVIGLARLDAAASEVIVRGFAENSAFMFVLAGSLIDIVLGGAVLIRRFSKLALCGMIAVTLAYLAAATLFAADLWLDPLGPLVKTVPALFLTFVALAILEER